MIQLQKLQKYFGTQDLFNNVNLNIGQGEKIGLVGRNGTGKSTLFKIIMGELLPDGGEVSIPVGYRLGALEQHIHFTKPTVLEECTQVLKPEEQYDFYKAEKILFGLGFSQEDMDKDPMLFSGGYQIRINLTKVLLTNPNMLLLDEPTNYLDIVSLRWLSSFLRSFSGEVLLITHDRSFMDEVVTHVMGIRRGELKKIKGDTSKYYEQIHLEEEIHEQTRLNQEKKKKEMQDFVDRFRAKASKATQAQSKLKQLGKMQSLEKLSVISDLNFSFNYTDCPAKFLMEAEDLSFSYSGKEEDNLFSRLNLSIGKHDRIGIIGKNGKGKSTLLSVIAGELKPKTGFIKSHPALKKGYFGQTNISRLHEKNTIENEINEVDPSLTRTHIRGLCGAMMFDGDKAEKLIKVLSGGEKSRVLLGKILATPSNLLLLDEPTNHLDMESIESLGDALERFSGAAILVTHNEMLLRNFVNKLVVFRNNTAELFEGTYDEFLEKIGWDDELLENKSAKDIEPKLSKKEIKKRKQEIISKRSKELTPIRENIETYESHIEILEKRLESLNEEIISASTSGDGELITKFSQETGAIHIKLSTIYENLEEAMTKLESKEEEYNQMMEEF